MRKTFKVEFTLQSDNDIEADELKDRLYRKVDDFQIENSEGKDVNIETVDYWKTAKVTEV